MSILMNQVYASPDTPLWLAKGLASSNVGNLAIVLNPPSIVQNAKGVLGSFTFPTGVNSVSLQGWMSSIGGSGTSTGTIYLSNAGGTSGPDITQSTLITGVTLQNGGTCYFQLDNLQLYSPVSFTTIYLMYQNSSATATGSLTLSSASGTWTYGTALPGSWALSANSGSVIVTGG